MGTGKESEQQLAEGAAEEFKKAERAACLALLNAANVAAKRYIEEGDAATLEAASTAYRTANGM